MRVWRNWRDAPDLESGGGNAPWGFESLHLYHFIELKEGEYYV